MGQITIEKPDLEIGDLPESWIETGLDQLLAALETGSRPKGGVRGIKDGIPSIGGEHLNDDGGFRFETIKFVPHSFFEKMSRGLIHAGDILVVKDGATTGKVSLVRDDFPYDPAVVNEHVFICRPAEDVYPPFLFYFLFSKEGQDRILENFQGSAQGGINQSFAPGTAVPLAPLAEQERIVAKVDELLSRVTAARARLAKVPAILKRFRQSVLVAACSGRLTEEWRAEQVDIESASELVKRVYKQRPNRFDTSDLPEVPEEWTWVRLPDLGKLSRGKSRHRPRNAPHLYGGPYPFIQTGDIAQSGGRIIRHKQTYNQAGLAQSRLWPSGTVCITIAANIADSAILTYPACFPDSVAGLIVEPKLCVAEYAEFFIRTARNDLSQFAPATAQKNINIAILSDVVVPLPSLAEQHEIVRRVEALFKLADAIERRVAAATARAEKLTQVILAKAFRGELVPTEAELARREGRDYEPATVLLERIQTNRPEKTATERQAERNHK
ncbi:MAG: restriction endonuclease subunit S [Candidatus Latescibacteria bacterium]|nr:restriction endonuclease subunit S [Candidatus Latescibacterota bacterium]